MKKVLHKSVPTEDNNNPIVRIYSGGLLFQFYYQKFIKVDKFSELIKLIFGGD